MASDMTNIRASIRACSNGRLADLVHTLGMLKMCRKAVEGRPRLCCVLPHTVRQRCTTRAAASVTVLLTLELAASEATVGD